MTWRALKAMPYLLEPQPWKSFKQAFRKRKMPDSTREHFRNIKLKPEHFAEFLRAEAGGFREHTLCPTNRARASV